MPVTSTLSPKQILAAQHLALGESQGKAAQKAEVTRVTVTRWLKNPLFRQKIEEFRKELQAIEGEVFTEVAKENARESAKRILTPDELKSMLSEMALNEELSPMIRLKASTQLGKWLGLEAPKPPSEGKDEFPINFDTAESKEISSLSDEELQRRYLETLGES